jgi:Carboxypeptidase regulatory-like domain
MPGFGHKMIAMKPWIIVAGVVVAVFAMASSALGQKDTQEPPTALLSFLVIKDDNGKPVRNAAVIMHAVSAKGKQEKGDLELKTDPEGKTSFDGIPYGMLRVQVLAQGFQTYGEDFDIEKRNVDITIKMKRPQGQYSIYEDHPKDSNSPPKQDAPPAGVDKKPN